MDVTRWIKNAHIATSCDKTVSFHCLKLCIITHYYTLFHIFKQYCKKCPPFRWLLDTPSRHISQPDVSKNARAKWLTVRARFSLAKKSAGRSPAHSLGCLQSRSVRDMYDLSQYRINACLSGNSVTLCVVLKIFLKCITVSKYSILNNPWKLIFKGSGGEGNLHLQNNRGNPAWWSIPVRSRAVKSRYRIADIYTV